MKCCHGSVKMAHDLENNSSPTSEKTEQVARVPTGRSRVCQGDKQQHVTPGVRSEMQNVSAAGGYAGSHILGRGAQTRGHPLGESILPEDRPQRSPGEQGKTQDPWQGQARVSLPTQVWCCQWVRETKYTEYRVARAASL